MQSRLYVQECEHGDIYTYNKANVGKTNGTPINFVLQSIGDTFNLHGGLEVCSVGHLMCH